MNIEAKDFEIKMTYGELWSTAFDVQSALHESIKTHWVNHQDSWKRNESERLQRLRNMFFALGRPELYDRIFPFADEVFAKFNAKKSCEQMEANARLFANSKNLLKAAIEVYNSSWENPKEYRLKELAFKKLENEILKSL
jgi:hypothetical protein